MAYFNFAHLAVLTGSSSWPEICEIFSLIRCLYILEDIKRCVLTDRDMSVLRTHRRQADPRSGRYLVFKQPYE
jgi:hypothetical protein